MVENVLITNGEPGGTWTRVHAENIDTYSTSEPIEPKNTTTSQRICHADGTRGVERGEP